LSINGGKVVCLSIATSTPAAVALDNKASGAASRNAVSPNHPEIVEFVPRQNKGDYHSDIATITHTAVALDRKLLAQLHAMSYLRNNLEIVELVPRRNPVLFLVLNVNLSSLEWSDSKEKLRQGHSKAQHGMLRIGTCLLDLICPTSDHSLFD
jgi:hypothetical protein